MLIICVGSDIALSQNYDPQDPYDISQTSAVCEKLLARVFAHPDRTYRAPATYTVSKEEFQKMADDAHQKYPDQFQPLAMFETLYRVDQSSPASIKSAGGLFGNPSKKDQSLIEHSRWGTGSKHFVSWSWDENIEGTILHLNFLPKIPGRILYKGKVNGRDISETEWFKISEKLWPIVTPLSDLPNVAMIKTYQYRSHLVEGVKVTAGNYLYEKEVITRGVDLNHRVYWREAVIKFPLFYEEVVVNNTKFLRMVLPPFSKFYRRLDQPVVPKELLELGEWKQLSP